MVSVKDESPLKSSRNVCLLYIFFVLASLTIDTQILSTSLQDIFFLFLEGSDNLILISVSKKSDLALFLYGKHEINKYKQFFCKFHFEKYI